MPIRRYLSNIWLIPNDITVQRTILEEWHAIFLMVQGEITIICCISGLSYYSVLWTNTRHVMTPKHVNMFHVTGFLGGIHRSSVDSQQRTSKSEAWCSFCCHRVIYHRPLKFQFPESFWHFPGIVTVFFWHNSWANPNSVMWIKFACKYFWIRTMWSVSYHGLPIPQYNRPSYRRHIWYIFTICINRPKDATPPE